MKRLALWLALALASAFVLTTLRHLAAAENSAPPAPPAATRPQVVSGPGFEIKLEAVPPKTPEEKFEYAWVRFCKLLRDLSSLTREERHKARLEAIGYARAAFEGSPGEARYAESLAYMYLKDESFVLARDYFEKACRLSPKEPRPALLYALASGAAVISQPKRNEADIAAAMAAFRKAARLDGENCLPYLVGASVAFTLQRRDLAEGLLEEALRRKALRLYFLPIPQAMFPDNKFGSTFAWYLGQNIFWADLRSACANVVNASIALGRELETKKEVKPPAPASQPKATPVSKRGAKKPAGKSAKPAPVKPAAAPPSQNEGRTKNLEAALSWYRRAMRVGKRVAYAEPLLFYVALDALGQLEASYVAQEQVLRALEASYAAQEQALRALGRAGEADAVGSKLAAVRSDLASVTTEMGVVNMARMFGDDQRKEYANLLATRPPSSWAELEKLEEEAARLLRRWAGPREGETEELPRAPPAARPESPPPGR